MTTNELSDIADVLVDEAFVKNKRIHQMNDEIRTYKRANMFLGYCSQLKEYSVHFESLITKLMLYRKEIIKRYKYLLLENNIHVFKSLLIPPMKTQWYIKGIMQYKQITKYCIWSYRRKIQRAIDANNDKYVCQVIDTVIMADKHYNIYKSVIEYYIKKNETFASIMNEKYMSYMQL